MDLTLVKMQSEQKTAFTIRLYDRSLAQLDKIAAAEGVKTSHLVRHLVNDFIMKYDEAHPGFFTTNNGEQNNG